MRKVFIRTLLVVAALAMLVGGRAQAIVVFDNGAPNGTNGLEMTRWVQADDFTLAAPSNLRGVHFWTLENTSPPAPWDGTLQWHIFADAGGVPAAAPLHSGVAINIVKTATGVTIPLRTEYEYLFDFDSPVLLAGGTTFWLALHANADFSLDNIYWERTAGGSGAVAASSDGGTFDNWETFPDPTPAQLAFLLLADPLPEPGTMLLLGAGMIGLGAFTRRRR
jgi:hypothetical protein